jgi:anaerobic selenocysteine-containing dehydrogenase
MLLTPKNHTRFLNTTYSHHHGQMEEGPFIELDAADAAVRGIADGDVVRICNDRGELVMPARISGRLRPGVVAVPWGWWGAAANINILTNDTLTDWGGGVAYFDTMVDVSK